MPKWSDCKRLASLWPPLSPHQKDAKEKITAFCSFCRFWNCKGSGFSRRPPRIRNRASSDARKTSKESPAAENAFHKQAGGCRFGDSIGAQFFLPHPVFVSAEQIRKTRARRQPMIQTGQSAFHSASNDSLTAESLAKRWLHSSAL